MKSPHFEVFLKRILYYSPTSLLALLARVFASKCIIPKSSKKRVRPLLCTSLVPHLQNGTDWNGLERILGHGYSVLTRI